jgi:hypothetical protein
MLLDSAPRHAGASDHAPSLRESYARLPTCLTRGVRMLWTESANFFVGVVTESEIKGISVSVHLRNVFASGRGCVETKIGIRVDAMISGSRSRNEKHRTHMRQIAVHQQAYSINASFHTASARSGHGQFVTGRMCVRASQPSARMNVKAGGQSREMGRRKKLKTERTVNGAAANLRQCWARNKPHYLTRCGRLVETRYCHEHRAQPFVLLALLLLGLLATASDVGQVAQYLLPVSAEQRALERRVYSKVSLIAHGWKLRYFALHPDGMNAGAKVPDGQPSNLWKRLQEGSIPEFNKENWIRYYPLFSEEIERVCRELQETQAAYSDVLKPETRILMENTCSSMIAVRNVYYYLPRGGMGKDTPMGFRGMLIQMFRELGALDDEVQRLRDAIPEDDDLR